MKFLIVQTAFIGDVVLATPIIEKLRRQYPDAEIDFLLRRGNETLFSGHPHIRRIWVWDKRQEKYRGLWRLSMQLRQERYDWVINCQRFASSGFFTLLCGAKNTVGFSKNPLSWLFSRRIPHYFGTPEQPLHETERNLALISHLTDTGMLPPRLYPTEADQQNARIKAGHPSRYVCIAPTSVWFTKQYPAHKWEELICQLPSDCTVFLLGGPGDVVACEAILSSTRHPDVQNIAGKLSFLESAAFMQNAQMNYVNDSAPMHLASAVNAPVAAVFCSTVPRFGFTPLSKQSIIIETTVQLPCRPCGIHGHRSCPKDHFACAETINWQQFPLPE